MTEPKPGMGLCGCGCGQSAPIARATNNRRGSIKGQPQKFIRGHATTRKPRSECTAENCDQLTTGDYCRRHAELLQKYGNLIGKRPKGNEEFRFWFRVDKSGDCWVWTGGTSRQGYGAFWTKEKRLVRANRFSYEMHYGPIPEGMFVCHRCDNPPCVRPDHLFLGTPADNIHDMDAKGRGRRPGKRMSCPKGHPYDEVNSVPRKDGAQSCWQCRKEWRKTTRDRQANEAIAVRCARCGSGIGQPCTGRFGVMAGAHPERLRAVRNQPDGEGVDA